MDAMTAFDALARFDPSGDPVVSLYLDLRPDQRGRDAFAPFVRKEFKHRARSYPADAAARVQLDDELARIEAYLEHDLDPSANGLALFACTPRDLFLPLPLQAAFDAHRLHIGERPQLSPLARVVDSLPRYAAALFDSHTARIFVFGLGAIEREARIEHEKTHRTDGGGWSQARFQRHVDNSRTQHLKEVMTTLDRIVRDEGIGAIILAGEAATVAEARSHLAPEVAAKVVDDLSLDIRTPERDVLRATLDRMREHDAADDRERVDRVLGAFRAGALGVAGLEATAEALVRGQVDELLLGTMTGTSEAAASAVERLVGQARRTGARVTFIEDGALLQEVDGVAAALRFTL